VREGEERGLPDETRVLYVSPLKALSNDIHKNLEEPLAGIRDELLCQGRQDVEIRALVRTGDTPQHERAQMRRTPPHIVVTTPESLFILLTSESGRADAGDRAHRDRRRDPRRGRQQARRAPGAVAGAARALRAQPPQRIGLSATQKPVEAVARNS
jgi:ATP-dependent helicase Lhr and Lhr-like helicase